MSQRCPRVRAVVIDRKEFTRDIEYADSQLIYNEHTSFTYWNVAGFTNVNEL